MNTARLSRSKLAWSAAIALMLLVSSLAAAGWLSGTPKCQGKRLRYWLAQLEPTVITPGYHTESWPQQRFRNLKAASNWTEGTRARHEHASAALTSAGPECLPALFADLTALKQPLQLSFHRHCADLKRWAFARGWTDSAPFPNEDDSEVRRGQALTAILLLRERARPLVPKLAMIAARQQNDAASRAASYALWELDPDEFLRVRGQAPQ